MLKSITVYSRDMRHLDERAACLWPMKFACLCEAAAEANLFPVRPPVLILNKTTIAPINHEAINELSNEIFADALLDGWESAQGVELDIDGYKRRFTYSACRTRDIELRSNDIMDNEDDHVICPMDVLSIKPFKDLDYNCFLKAFVGLLPFSGRDMTISFEESSFRDPQILDLDAIKAAAAEFQARQAAG